MYRGKTFKVTQEVAVEVGLDEVMENIDHDDLLEALLEQGCDVSSAIGDMDPDDVLDELQHRDVVQWVVSNVDTDEILDALKEADDDGLTGWLEDHRDVLPVDVKTETPKPEPTPPAKPLIRPSLSMHDNKVFVATREEELSPLTLTEVGTYTIFGGVIAVTALGVEFMTTSLSTAESILSVLAFTQSNTFTEV